jgi:hypothetical protein
MRCHVALFTVCITLIWVLFCGLDVKGADGNPPAAGTPVGGLRLRLHAHATKKDRKKPGYYLVEIENVGNRDLNVRLGFSLNNGRSHHPDAFDLIVTAPGKQPRRLIYFDGLGGVAGRVDPLVVPLPVGASYTLRFPFDSFVTPVELKPLDMTATDYQIAVVLTGRSVTDHDVNLDTKGQVLMACWEGKARSNQLQVKSREATRLENKAGTKQKRESSD